MPGIFGCVRLPGSALPLSSARDLLERMAERLRHFPGDRFDFWEAADGSLALGRIRHPTRSEVPWGVGADGEAEFRVGDPGLSPSTLAAAVEGRQGSWTAGGTGALVVHQSTPTRVLIATDRRASVPVYYARTSDGLLFAPEIKALQASPTLDRRIDPGAAGLFLASGFLPADLTLFASVRRLPGGRCLVVDAADPRTVSYFDYQLRAEGDGTPLEQLSVELAELVQRTVGRAFQSADTDTALLSGGVDSRAILAAICAGRPEERNEIRTITWAAPETAEIRGSDVDIARRIARALGVRHQVVHRSLRHHGWHSLRTHYLLDGQSDLGAFHAYELELVRELRANGCDVVLRGDECFGFREAAADHRTALLEVDLRSLVEVTGWRQVLPESTYRIWADASEEVLRGVAAGYAARGLSPTAAKDTAYFEHRLQTYLNASGYFKSLLVDHRAPLVDDEILELNARIPDRGRVDKRVFVAAARRILPEVWSIPLASTHNLESFGHLLATDTTVREGVRRELADDASGVWDYLDRRALEELLATLREGGGASRTRARARRAVSSVLSLAPGIRRRIRDRHRRRFLRSEEILLRAVALKQWYDVFATGDGTRQAVLSHAERLGHAVPEAEG